MNKKSCAYMQHAGTGNTWVAAGTIFLDVLVWVVSQEAPFAQPPATRLATPMYRLKGHEGSIHRWALPDSMPA